MNSKYLLDAFLSSNSLDSLTEAAAAYLDCRILICDNAFHLVSHFESGGFADEDYKKTVMHSKLPMNICAEISSGTGNATLNIGHYDYIVRSLSFSDIFLGYAVYVVPENKKLPEKNTEFTEKLLSKQFFSERRSYSLPSDTAEEILIDLLDGNFSDSETFKLRTSGTFLNNFSPERFALIDFSEGLKDKNEARFLKSDISDMFHASLPFFYKGKMIVFLHFDHDIGDLKKLAESLGVAVMISNKTERLYDLKRDFFALNTALEKLKAEKQPPFLEYYEDHALNVALSSVYESFGFMSQNIKELLNYDSKNSSELVLTLYTYIICGRSLNRTGQRLFTHRNTVSYRLKKIREDFGIDIDDPETFAETFISLCIALNLSERLQL